MSELYKRNYGEAASVGAMILFVLLALVGILLQFALLGVVIWGIIELVQYFTN